MKAKQRLFEKLRRELLRYFRRRVPSAVVEDLTQQTLVIVIPELNRSELGEPKVFRAFVFKAAFNRVRSYRRREELRRRERDAPGSWAIEAPSASDVVLWLERTALVREALKVLRTTFRPVLESRLQGEDPGDYADAEDIKLGSVRTRVRRAMMALREVLAARSKSSKPPPAHS